MAQFKDLLVFGTMRVTDTVYAKRFVGAFEGSVKGNADTATKAAQDNLGQKIENTYIKNITGDGSTQTITVTYGDDTTKTFTTQDTKTVIDDNLTTEKADQALSSNQGVVLNNRVTDLEGAATVGTF